MVAVVEMEEYIRYLPSKLLFPSLSIRLQKESIRRVRILIGLRIILFLALKHECGDRDLNPGYQRSVIRSSSRAEIGRLMS